MPSFDWEIANRYRRRLAKQAGYQREHRKDLKAHRLPERDDVAKVVLKHLLGGIVRRPKETTDKLIGEIADRLAAAGFDRDGSEERIRAMAARHSSAARKRRA